MKIDVTNRGSDGLLSFKAESQSERLQLEWMLNKSKDLHLDAFDFNGWDQDKGGISFIIQLKQPE